ncbi:sporulation integral membrane protein YtvI [Clostridium sp. JN-1]|uniref:sporulation integral membrane protein YtvI n=1 Tax=Clostridium sp. JN-1 TaxID=2483110 RepID=UPI000F0B9820|nr:sporulation integral membrane protein YtvI [Clostridium sp. JN-1]
MDKFLNKIDKIIIFFLLYTLVFLIFFSTLSYTLPFVLALVFALILKKPTKFLMKRFKLKNSLASLITTILFFSIITCILYYGITNITQETVQFGKNAQSYISNNSSNLYSYMDKLKSYYNNLDPSIVNTIEKTFSGYVSKISNITVSITSKIVSMLLNFLASIPYLIMLVIFTLFSTYFFTKDIASTKNKILNILSESKANKISNIYIQAKHMLTNYFLSYLFIIGLTFIETLIVFLIFKVKYALMLSIICAIADVLPILGIGVIYIPLAIIYFLMKNYIVAVGLIISYILVSTIRQIIEPKVVSSSLGLHPVAVLAALYIGIKVHGFLGIIFCMFLVVFYNILKKVNIL